MLGPVTSLFGKNAIAATTVAVEGVVLRHLAQQLWVLRGVDQPAVNAISAIVSEEQEHHDHYAVRQKAGAFWPCVLSPVVTASTEVVIWLGMRL